MYHANAFELIKSEELPVFIYQASIDPKPANRPQFYQILGVLAKRIMYSERKPIVSIDGVIESLPDPISSSIEQDVKIPEVGEFTINLTQASQTKISLKQFENYSHLVNRLADVALTAFSHEYYKFHPKAPYILRDEPYFDNDLIERIGILDSKSYYRGLMELGDRVVFVLNRETQLRSYKNLLVELKCLAKLFEEKNDIRVDFYNPPSEFIDFVNYLTRGKAAEVAHSCYPGPSIRKISGISWKYRAGDKVPGLDATPIDYLRNTYGITGLDAQQPLVMYEIENIRKMQYHVPEVLSVGHTFEDLQKRIPSWQRTQVWGSIHPDCKNQLHKIYDVLMEIDRTLRANIPEVYPKLVEISTETIDVSSLVSQPSELQLVFGNKDMKITTPYDVAFYHSYSNKKISYVTPLSDLKALLCTEKVTPKIKKFADLLSSEYKLRNNSRLDFDYGSLDPDKNDFSKYKFVLTISSEDQTNEEIYCWYKKTLQNEMGIAHQHVTVEKADDNSVMQIIMQICLKLGGEPWLLPKSKDIPYVVAVSSYLDPFSGRSEMPVLVSDGQGRLLKQYDPIEQTGEVVELLTGLNKRYQRVLFLTSFDRFGISEKIEDALREAPDEYCIVKITDNASFRFFETYTPKKAPRFGKAAMELSKNPIEAFENAPQGRILRSGERTFYLLTGRTIEKETLKRGCPTPIKMEIVATKGEGWKLPELANYVLSLCMMGRASGHMARFPMPLYYLKQRSYYVNKFGVPKDEKIKQRVFYI